MTYPKRWLPLLLLHRVVYYGVADVHIDVLESFFASRNSVRIAGFYNPNRLWLCALSSIPTSRQSQSDYIPITA
jgi:hypothetical protein